MDNLLDAFIPGPGQTYNDGGGVLDRVNEFGFHRGLYRPFIDKKGRPSVVLNVGTETVKGEKVRVPRRVSVSTLLTKLMAGKLPGVDPQPIFAANATSMRKESWIKLDTEVERAYRERLTFWATLMANVPYGGFDGMSYATLEYEAMSDPGEAVVDMDAMSEGRNDTPLFKLRSVPLPITHSDFWMSERRRRISARGTPLDTAMGEAAGRRIAEMLEKTALGVSGGFAGFAYGGQTTGRTAHDTATYTSALGASTVYGATTWPMRLTKTNFTAPTAGGWTPDTLRNEVLAALNQLYAIKSYGPFAIFHSTDWTPYMEQTFSVSGGNHSGETTRSMLLKTAGVSSVQRVDLLTSTYTLIILSLNRGVVEAVNGMGITTVTWPSQGGMRHNWKVMCIQVPRWKGDYSGNSGVLIGTTA